MIMRRDGDGQEPLEMREKLKEKDKEKWKSGPIDMNEIEELTQ